MNSYALLPDVLQVPGCASERPLIDHQHWAHEQSAGNMRGYRNATRTIACR